MPRIIVDLTPLTISGANGGAKILSLRLIHAMAKLDTAFDFVLLGNHHNIQALNSYIVPRITTLNVSQFYRTLEIGLLYLLFKPLLSLSKKFLPARIYSKLNIFYTTFKNFIISHKLRHKLHGDLLFCPFTAPFYAAMNIPIVSTILDLQSIYYPFYFSRIEQLERQQHFIAACKKSSFLIAISDFVRSTVLEQQLIHESKIKTIYIRLADRLNAAKPTDEILAKLALESKNYLIYPANFWLHKNHLMLFVAFNLFLSKANSTLKLVCTGTPNALKDSLLQHLQEMNLQESVILPGYLNDQQFSDLLTHAKGMIYPSLYEGFGMPLLEAMINGIPVACSRLSSLPEIAGNAAIYFDPRKPTEIAAAIEKLNAEATVLQNYIKLGFERAKLFADENHMAKEYLATFKSVLAAQR